jgi:hypothetical protein
MLRLPTEESGGRANVTQGALAVGIDIASGITTYAVAHKVNPSTICLVPRRNSTAFSFLNGTAS